MVRPADMKRRNSFGGLAEVLSVFTENDDEPESELAAQLSLAEQCDLMLKEKDIWEREREDLEELVSHLQRANRKLVEEKAALVEDVERLRMQLAALGIKEDIGGPASSAAGTRVGDGCDASEAGSADGTSVAASVVSNAAGTDAPLRGGGKNRKDCRRNSFDGLGRKLSALIGNTSFRDGCEGSNADDDSKASERSPRHRAAERAEKIRVAQRESAKAAREYDECYESGSICAGDLGGSGSGDEKDYDKLELELNASRGQLILSSFRHVGSDRSVGSVEDTIAEDNENLKLELEASRGQLLLASFQHVRSDRSLGSAEEVITGWRGGSERHSKGQGWWKESCATKVEGSVDDLGASLGRMSPVEVRTKRRTSWFGGKPAA